MEIMPTSSKMTERTNGCLPFQAAPMSNTGGALSESYAHLVMMNGKVKEIILKRGNQQAGFIDTLTVVLHEDTFIPLCPHLRKRQTARRRIKPVGSR